jgi:O-antigen ligase
LAARPLVAIWIALLILVPIAAYMANGVVIALCVAALGAPRLRYWPQWWRHRALRPPLPALALLLIWMMMTSAYAIDPGEAAAKGLRLFALFGITIGAISACESTSVDNARRMGLALGIAMISLIALVSIEYAAGGLFLKLAKDYPRELLVRGLDMTLHDYTLWRVHNALGRSGVVLIALGPAALLALSTTRLGRRGTLAVGLAGAALILILPIATAKIALIATLLATLGGYFLPRATVVSLTLGILALLMGMPLIALAMDPAMPFGFDAKLVDVSLQHRFYIWHFTAERISEHPWLGWGLESARAMPGAEEAVTVYKNGLPHLAHTVMLPLHPHNLALHIWVEGGAIGALALGAAIIGLGQSLDRMRRDRALFAAALGSVAGLLVIASASFGLWQDWWLSCIALTAVFLSALRRARGGI